MFKTTATSGPLSLSVEDDYNHRKEKALEAIEDDKDKAQMEQNANDIFMRAFRESNWMPYGKQLLMESRHQTVSPTSKTALTASQMTMEQLMRLGWEFARLDPHSAPTLETRDFNLRRPRPLALRIEEALEKLERILNPNKAKLVFPSYMRPNSLQDLHIDSSNPRFTPTDQLRRLSNALFIMLENGELKDHQGRAHPGSAAHPGQLKPIINWTNPPHCSLLQPEIALGSLFHINLFRPTSEIEVERTIGSVLLASFQAVHQNIQVTSNRQLVFYGPLTAFGSRPRPDLCARCRSVPHPLFQPVCWLGEAKLHKEHTKNTIAQLATSAHSTLVLFVLLWSLAQGDPPPQEAASQHPGHSSSNATCLPLWAFLVGMAYTEEVIEIHAFYPFHANINNKQTWKFRSTLLSSFHRIQEQSAIYKLHFIDCMVSLRDHANRFGNEMENLFKMVCDINPSTNSLQISPKIIQERHPNTKAKLKKINEAFTHSVRKWEKILRLYREEE